MQPDALTKDDQPIWASQFSTVEWGALEVQSQTDRATFRVLDDRIWPVSD